MPRKWSAKDERQYEHIKHSIVAHDNDSGRAEEIAARTVNKQRRSEGRTPQAATQGTGNPALPLHERSKQELYNRARQLGIEGRSSMSKSELISAIRTR
jgi:plasmid stabilization system protein ParE